MTRRSGSGQSLRKRTLPVSVQVRNSLKADKGWNGKTVYSLAHPQAKPVRPNAVSPANTDKLKKLLVRTVRRSSSVEDTRLKLLV